MMCFLLIVIVLCGCTQSTSSQNTDKSWEDIRLRGEFTVGVDQSFKPMTYKDQYDEWAGFDVDLARAVAHKLAVKVDFQPIVWEKGISVLSTREIDALWSGMTINDKRIELLGITKPYLYNRQIVMVKKGSNITNKADLADRKMGVLEGSNSQKLLRNDKTLQATIKEAVNFVTVDDMMTKLQNDKVDAVIVEEVLGRGETAQNAQRFWVADIALGSSAFGIGVRKEDKAWLDKLNEALQALKKDGTLANISKKWFAVDITK